MNLIGKAKPVVTISAIVTRADGTVEDLGEIASSKKKNVFGKIVDFFKKK